MFLGNVGRTAQSPCHGLQDVTEDIEVSSGEDEENASGEGDGGCAGVLPLSCVSVALLKSTQLDSRSEAGRTWSGSL